MVRQRNRENKPYPKGWRVRRRGTVRSDYVISYRVPKTVKHLWDDKSEFELGRAKTLPSAEKMAYKEWERRIVVSENIFTMSQLFNRYIKDVIPNKAAATKKSNIYSMKRLKSVIPATMPVNQFKTHMAFQYRDQCAQKESPKKANLDLQVLSHCFTKAFEWGCDIIEHPIKGKVPKIQIKPRDRYVSDDELAAFLTVCNPMQRVYIPLKIATGKDKSMLLSIRMADIKDDGLHFPKRKKISSNAKAKSSVMPFYDQNGESTGLREIIDDIIEWRKKHSKIGSIWLFSTKQGQPYIKPDGTTSAFDSPWQRNMKKASSEGILDEKFTEHDLCAKTASDAETLEHAANMRGHLNKATTHNVYRRKPDIVMPLKRKNKDDD